MTLSRIIELLQIEHECILRNSHGECNRDCENCDLVQDDSDLHEMYTDAIGIMKGHIPVHPIRAEDMDTWSGAWWYVCPSCRIAIDYNDRFCRHCGKELIWDD